MQILKFSNKLITRFIFIGEIPIAPGTCASFFAVLLLYYFPFLNNLYVIILLLFLGIIGSNFEEVNTNIKDNQKIVIDEITGMFVTFVFLPVNLWNLILGFILFRLFDIKKVSLINSSQNLPQGWGVMADDILAGISANVILRLLFYIFG